MSITMPGRFIHDIARYKLCTSFFLQARVFTTTYKDDDRKSNPTRAKVIPRRKRKDLANLRKLKKDGRPVKPIKNILRKSETVILAPSAMVMPAEKALEAGYWDKKRDITIIGDYKPQILQPDYDVRGAIAMRALEIEAELQKGAKKPFERVIRANIGDAHAMGQAPITYIRQVIACAAYPELLQSNIFPSDVKQRAEEILCSCGGQSVGSYSMSMGIELIRRDVAAYIENRDGQKCNFNNVCLSTGASTAIKNVLQMFVNEVDGKKSGVLIPIPQYPLYSASLAEFGLAQVGYYLNEDKGWALDIPELARALKEGNETYAVRALVVINPGNPTGQVLTRKNIETIIKFAYDNRLFIFADEVYQDNVYAQGSEFHSFKKVMMELGPPYSEMEMASFMTISKGYMGECGLRGGWMEIMNLDPTVQANLYKAISAMLCPTVLGQARPPKEGDPSYELWLKERCAVLSSLDTRAKMVVETFNKMEGFKCNEVQGAMYAFPRIDLPAKAIAAAKKAKQPPDTFYAWKLLEETGICIIPGSGFGQRPDTYHFRTTILPQPDLLKKMLEVFQKFQQKFTKEYS